MSELSDPRPADAVTEPIAPAQELVSNPDVVHPDTAANSPLAPGADESPEVVPEVVPELGASRPDPWGSMSAPVPTQRAVWPTINNWRSPLVPPTPPPPASPSPSSAHGDRRGRSWMAIAMVAALIGAVIGASSAFLVKQNRSTALITIREGTALPGAAILASGTPIPKLVDAVSPSVVSIDVMTSIGEDEGTGMIISSNGLVVTNNHVVAAYTSVGAGQITVTRTGTATPLQATLLGSSQQYDVALLQIQNISGLPAITFGNSAKLVVGDGVVAIGNALGLAAGTPTVTSGIVSALGRTVSASDAQTGASETLYGMIQTDAAINPGNSGGPLIDSSGQVVGMNTAVAGATSNGSAAQNIGFAIPAARIEHLLSSLISMHLPTTPKRKGGFLGVELQTITHAHARSSVRVLSVVKGDPARDAGIRAGDVIVSISGHAIFTFANVTDVMMTIKPGTTIQVVIERKGERLTYEVTVIEPPSSG